MKQLPFSLGHRPTRAMSARIGCDSWTRELCERNSAVRLHRVCGTSQRPLVSFSCNSQVPRACGGVHQMFNSCFFLSLSRARRSEQWNLPGSNAQRSPSETSQSQTNKDPLASPPKRATAAAKDQENASPSTSALGKGRCAPSTSAVPTKHMLQGSRRVSDGNDDDIRGRDGLCIASDRGGSGGGTLWALPGQTCTTAGAGARGSDSNPPTRAALGEARRFTMIVEDVAGKPASARGGEKGKSGDSGGGGRASAKTGDREGLSLLGSLLRSPLALPAQTSAGAASRVKADVRSSTWALGKARRRSTSPQAVEKCLPSRGGGGGVGRSGCVPTAGPSLAVAAATNGAGATSPAPRSILVTNKGPASARRVGAVSRGVRWLDVVQKEQQQAISRRKRALKWTGGCRKREGPPPTSPRASRASVLSRQGDGAAAAS